MNQQIGTCSICGGAVTKFFGTGGGGIYPPKATCQNCGAVQDNGYDNYGVKYPVVPMKRYEVQVGGGGAGSGGGGGDEPCCATPQVCKKKYCSLKKAYDSKPQEFKQGEVRPWNGLTFSDCPDDKFPNKDFRGGALWAEQLLKERNK
jgi:hypothetical protein